MNLCLQLARNSIKVLKCEMTDQPFSMHAYYPYTRGFIFSFNWSNNFILPYFLSLRDLKGIHVFKKRVTYFVKKNYKIPKVSNQHSSELPAKTLKSCLLIKSRSLFGIILSICIISNFKMYCSVVEIYKKYYKKHKYTVQNV